MIAEAVKEGSVSPTDPIELELFVGEGNLTHECHGSGGCFLGCPARWYLELLPPGSSGPRIPGGCEPNGYLIRGGVFLDNGDPLGGRKDLFEFLERNRSIH